MSVGVIIKSCQKNRALRDAQRATWLPSLPLSWGYRYFVGGMLACEPDVMKVSVPDDLPGIALKLGAALAWAAYEDISHVFVCDDDTYVVPSRLVTCGYERRDYCGFLRIANSPNARQFNDGVSYAQGSAFWLSRRAVGLILEAGTMVAKHPDDGAVGKALVGKVDMVHDHRYEVGPNRYRTPLADNDVITTHKCDPAQMLEAHQRWSRSYREGVTHVVER